MTDERRGSRYAPDAVPTLNGMAANKLGGIHTHTCETKNHPKNKVYLGRPQRVGGIPRPDLVHQATLLQSGAGLEGRRVALLSPRLHEVHRSQERVLGPDSVDNSSVDDLLREYRVSAVSQSESAERESALCVFQENVRRKGSWLGYVDVRWELPFEFTWKESKILGQASVPANCRFWSLTVT